MTGNESLIGRSDGGARIFQLRIRLLSLCVVLALATPAFAQNAAAPQHPGAGPLGRVGHRTTAKSRAEPGGQPHQRAAAEQHEFRIRFFQPYAGCVEYSASHTGGHQRELEPDYANHSATCVAALPRPEHWR